MSRKHKKVCTTLNSIEHFLILASTITGFISISAFTSLICIPIGITISAIGLRSCAIAARIKSIIKKKRKRHVKIKFLAKSKLSKIAALISKALINSNISYDGFVLINNVLKEYDEMKEETKIERLKHFIKDFSPIIKQFYCID